MPELRRRATVLAIREGKFLLLRSRGRNRYGLPGARVNGGDSLEEAAHTALLEETGLRATRLRRLFAYRGKANSHTVFEAEVSGDLPAGAAFEYLWWNRRQQVPLHSHVSEIMKRYRRQDSLLWRLLWRLGFGR